MSHDTHQETVVSRGRRPARCNGMVAGWMKVQKRRMAKAYI